MAKQYNPGQLERIFHTAVKTNSIEKAKQALSEGVDINCTADGGKDTALHIATRAGGAEILTFILSKNPDMEVHDSMGYTPLVLAARSKDTGKIDLLLKAGAKIDGRDEKGWTALHHAINFKHIETAKQLLAAGANPAQQDSEGTSLADFARQKGFPELADSIEKQITDAIEQAEAAKRPETGQEITPIKQIRLKKPAPP